MEFLNNEGRLLMLPILYQEASIKNNKNIHDIHNPFNCTNTWPVCQCQFSKMIRGYDIGFNFETVNRLREAI